MSDTTEPMAYISRAQCGCIRMATVDNPERAREVAKEVAKAVRRGETVERVTCQHVRETPFTRPDCTTHNRKARPASPETQAALL